MIKINFIEPDTDEWRTWKDECHLETQRLINSVQNGDKRDINEDLYKKHKSTYYIQFNGKCAYCEKKLEEKYESELDHFRPKKKVTDIDNEPIMVHSENGNELHPGYYWLTYHWENLILSCQLCNKPYNEEDKRLGKRNRFPLEDNNYAVCPGEEIHEKALLINPLKEDPLAHLEYSREEGLLNEKDGDIRGKTCIEIFGLNIRSDLIEGRKNAYDKTIALFIDVLTTQRLLISNPGVRNVLDELKTKVNEVKNGKQPHSIAALTAIRDLGQQIGPLL